MKSRYVKLVFPENRFSRDEAYFIRVTNSHKVCIHTRTKTPPHTCKQQQTNLHTFIHLFVYSNIHSFIHSLTHPFIISFIHSFMHSFVHLFALSFIRFFYSFVHPFTYFLNSFIHSSVRSTINSLTNACKTFLRGFRPRSTQTRFCSHRKWLKTRNFGFRKNRDCTIHVAKTKALISCAATEHSFSHDEAFIII